MKVLVLFSNPPDQVPLRLDKEDKIISKLCREFIEKVTIERQHASEIEDFHSLVIDGEYDIIQFSGHGSSKGIFLEKSNYSNDSSELVTAKRVVNIINLSHKSPLLTIFLSCYSDDTVSILSDSAPFVITSRNEVGDNECIIFVQGFYERLFRGSSIKTAFDHAINLLSAKEYPNNGFCLSRRSLIKKGNSLFAESKPSSTRDSILVNLDQVRDKINKFGLSEEEICHLIARKLTIHYWIFDRARESATIPIGRLLFGEFWWENANDVVNCSKLMKLQSDIKVEHWRVWSKLLTTYNDLASCEYRTLSTPSNPQNKILLTRTVNLFNSHIQRHLMPLRDIIKNMGFGDAIPHLEFAVTECDLAKDHLSLERYPQVVEALELALTNYHEVVTALQPPEEFI